MSGQEENSQSTADTSSGEETRTPSEPTDADTVCSCDSSTNEARFRNFEPTSSQTMGPVKIPIVGYEVMEERAKFTVSCLLN